MPDKEKANGFEMTAQDEEDGIAASTPATESSPMMTKRPLTRKERAKKAFKDHALMITTLIGVVIGFAIGFAARAAKPSAEALLWLDMPGDIFIRLLKLTIVPLIAANVVVVTASLDPKVNGKISLVAFGYIVAANCISAVIGLSVALIIKPGKVTNVGALKKVAVGKLTTSDVFADLFYNIFPDNLLGATMFKSQTRYIQQTDSALSDLFAVMKNKSGLEASDFSSLELLERRTVTQAQSVNMIGVLFCAFCFGLAARCAKEKGVLFIEFFKSVSDVVVQLMHWFLWITPVGACFMIAGSLAKVSNVVQTFSNLGLFILTVTVGLGIHFVLMQLALFVVSRRNPLLLLPKCFKLWLISFVTTSPVVAVPEMYDCCEAHGISPVVYRFVVPFSAALKGDGSAVFITSAAVFIAQTSGITLSAGSIFAVGLLVAASMMALPNIPSSSIVILVTVLSSVGVPVQAVALLFSIEWLLDRMRSGSIGLGHPYCTAFTYYVCLKDLRRKSEANGKVEDVEA